MYDILVTYLFDNWSSNPSILDYNDTTRLFYGIKTQVLLTLIQKIYYDQWHITGLSTHLNNPFNFFHLFPNIYNWTNNQNPILSILSFYNPINNLNIFSDDLFSFNVNHTPSEYLNLNYINNVDIYSFNHYSTFLDFCFNFIWVDSQGATSPLGFNLFDNIMSLFYFLNNVKLSAFSIPLYGFPMYLEYYHQYILNNPSIINLFNTQQNLQNISLLIFLLPLVLINILIVSKNKEWIKQITLIISFIIFFITLILFLNSNFITSTTLSNSFNFIYYFGFNTINFARYHIDSIFSCHLSFDNFNLLFILLSTFLITITILLSWNLKLKYINLYFIILTIINLLLILTFSTQNIFIFFISFESTLIPMFLLIYLWGSRERKLRAFYLLLYYTLVSAILMLIALVTIFKVFKTFNFYLIYQNIHLLSTEWQIFLFISFFFTFSSKIPMYPLHSWLPEAHVEAPTTGSVLLAGILLKIGVFALIKYVLILFPHWTYFFSPIIVSLATASIILSSLAAIRQNDLKRIIAYSSIAHMNLIVIGIFIFSTESILGALYQSISHGFVSSALFILIGILYDRYHSRLIYYYSGLIRVMPIFTIFFIFFTLANIAFPGTSNFMGEMILLFGISLKNYFIAIISSIGIILCGLYSLWLTNRISFGNISTQFITYFIDVNKRELYILILFSILTLIFGIYPQTNILNYQFINEYIHYNLT